MINVDAMGGVYALAAEQVVLCAANASTDIYNALAAHTQEGTDIVIVGGNNTGAINVVPYDQAALTNAINHWSYTMSASTTGAITTANMIQGVTYGLTGNQTVTLTTPSAVTTNFGASTLVFDTDIFTGPHRVAAMFNYTTGANCITHLEFSPALTFPLQGSVVWTGNNFNILIPREMTEEEKAAHAIRQAEYEVRMRAEEVERKIANGKAEDLLRRVLSKEQIIELEAKNHFHIMGKDGLKYRIGRGSSHNVKRVDPLTEEIKQSFCIHPKMQVPVPDTMLAQKLLLEGDPELFFKIAYTAPR